jgi:class 3 adenylate cyclase/tetratricopeptide (TPR) repeat protein
VLLVDDRDGEIVEEHALLDQRMRPDDDLSAFDRVPHRSREKRDGHAELATNRLDREEVLLRKRLRRRHQRSLMTTLDGAQEGVEGDHCLPGAHVALQEPLHRPRAAQVTVDLPDRLLLLGSELERKGGSVAVDELSGLTQRGRDGDFLEVPPTAQQPKLEGEELLEGEALSRGFDLLQPHRAVIGGKSVCAQGQPFARAQLRRQRVREEADQRERAIAQLAQLHGRDGLARGVERHETDRMQPRALARKLVALDLESSARLELAVNEEASARGEPVGEPRLVEPDRGRPPSLAVDHSRLHELEVAPPGWAHSRPFDRALHRRLLAEPQLAEACRLRPVEEMARDMLREVADRRDAETCQALRDLGSDAVQSRDRSLLVHPHPLPWRTLVHASEAGQRRARTHGEGQGDPTIGTRPDGSYTRAMAESRKTVTIVFADVTGSTALGEQADPETMRRIMERYFEEMRTVLESHGGTVEKFIGDAVMAVFGIPAVHEDDALRAVRAAAEMRDRLATLNEDFSARGITIAVRTGVNTGEVIAGDPADGQAFATGDAVNVAARLEQAAEPGEILLGALTYRLAREAIRAEAVEPLELKGKAQAVEAWRLVDVLAGIPAFTRRLDAPFVGRAEELARLRQAYDTARDSSSCQLMTITGAPGIGKSRLVRELVTSVGGEARVVVGRCLSYGDGITYWPLAEIVREVAGSDTRASLGELLAPEADGALASERLLAAVGATDEPARTEEIFWATRLLFERLAHERPLIAVVDDIHWAEPTLLDLIEYLVGFARAPILLACTARPDLFDVRPHWPREGTIELEALDNDQAAALIDALLSESSISPEVHEQIRERAEGNPLFVEQMLAFAAENGPEDSDVPPTIQALLAARLDRLPVDERSVLVRGAVEGRLFHRGAVSALIGEDERDGVPGRLLTLTRKDLVRPDESLFRGDDAFRFAHALVRDAAYEGAPKELRADLHERYASWVEERASERLSELEEIVAYHLEQSFRYRESLGEGAADLALRAGERLAAAGERAFKRGDFRAAANLLQRAHGLLPPGESRFELVSRLGESLFESGRLEEARALLTEAIEGARRGGAESLALRHEIERSMLEIQLDPDWSADQLRVIVERALPVLDAADDAWGLYRAWDALRVIEWIGGRLTAAIAASERALGFAERVGDPNLIANAMTGMLAPTWYADGSFSEIRPEHERHLEWARANGQRALEGSLVFVLGRINVEQGRLAAGEALVEEGLTVVDGLGLVLHGAGLRAMFSEGDLARDPQGAESRVRTTYELMKSLSETAYSSTLAASLAMILARRGALDEAEELTRESERLGSEDDVVTQAGWRSARARVLARRGRDEEAEALAREALAIAADAEYAEMRAEAHLALADVLSRSGKTDEAVSAAAVALTIFERKEMTASADAVRAKLDELQSSGSPSQ